MKDRSERRCTNLGDTDDIESQKRLFVESDAIGKKRGTLTDKQARLEKARKVLMRLSDDGGGETKA